MKTVTAFTVAHSITLAAGDARLRPRAVEAGRGGDRAQHRVRRRRDPAGRAGAREGSPRAAPWLVAFTFGLLHGFGFAGALSEVGLPAGHIPVALLFFNLGVEAGQLLFVAAVLALVAAARRIRIAGRAGRRWCRPMPSAAWRCSGSSSASSPF